MGSGSDRRWQDSCAVASKPINRISWRSSPTATDSAPIPGIHKMPVIFFACGLGDHPWTRCHPTPAGSADQTCLCVSTGRVRARSGVQSAICDVELWYALRMRERAMPSSFSVGRNQHRGRRVFLIAGPCVIESEVHALKMAEAIAPLRAQKNCPTSLRPPTTRRIERRSAVFAGRELDEGSANPRQGAS